jgi:hypothetical protein
VKGSGRGQFKDIFPHVYGSTLENHWNSALTVVVRGKICNCDKPNTTQMCKHSTTSSGTKQLKYVKERFLILSVSANERYVHKHG